jgi:hypothetical protein
MLLIKVQMIEILILGLIILVLVRVIKATQVEPSSAEPKRDKVCPPHKWRPRNDTTHSYICIICNRTPSDPSLDA